MDTKNLFSVTVRFYDERRETREASRDAIKKVFNKYKKNNQFLLISPDFDPSKQIQYHFNCLLKTNYIKGYLFSYKIKSIAKEDSIYAQIDPCESIEGCMYYAHARFAQYLLKKFKFPELYIQYFKSIIDSKKIYNDAWSKMTYDDTVNYLEYLEDSPASSEGNVIDQMEKTTG